MTILWVGLGVLLVILELMTTYFLVIFFAISAFVTALFSLFVKNISAQIMIFGIVSLLGLIFGKKTLQNYFSVNKNIKSSNVDALKGKVGVVEKQITLNDYGLVKVDGEIWTAKSLEDEILNEGEEVIVEKVDGVKLVVYLKG